MQPLLTEAQSGTLLRKKTLTLNADTLTVDSLSVVPESFSIALDSGMYHLLPADAKLVLNKNKLQAASLWGKEIECSFRVFSFKLSEVSQHKNPSLLEPDPSGRYNPFSYNPQKQSDNPLQLPGLNKSGSISRGVSFGNNQDVVVNSSLNLQLSGRLTDDIDIALAATDNNVPFQPGGNTQQIQDFDKVYIQLSNEHSKLIAGDFQLFRPNSYFMSFNKRAQGLSFSTSQQLNKGNKVNATASGAVSKGKFNRFVVQGIEGNQGPYRLRGAENELFIIVLSGTERVYIDGQLLVRGQENDYVIDYNTAEITFTAKRLVTKDKRIIVEFQYSDKNYARSLLHGGVEWEQQKLKLRMNIYSEQDSKNQPLQQELEDDDKVVLANAGDDILKAFTNGVDTPGFSSVEIRYKRLDSLGYPDVFVYSVHPDSAIYKVSFAYVGKGNGDYEQVKSSANGKVYQWMMPVAGVKQGSYRPGRLLIAPQQKQMATLGAEYAIAKNAVVAAEGAFSQNDKNTFSALDATNDNGYAFKLGSNKTFILHKGNDSSLTSPRKLNLLASYEEVSEHFSEIEWFRSPEFIRDWNRKASLLKTQRILGTGAEYHAASKGQIGYYFDAFFETATYSGTRHSSKGNFSHKGLNAVYSASYVQTSDSLANTNFLRHKADVSKQFKWLVLGAKDEQEYNVFRQKGQDSLMGRSYHFLAWEAYVQSPEEFKNKFRLFYQQRNDHSANGTGFSDSAMAHNIGLNTDLLRNPGSRLRTATTYRNLNYLKGTAKPDNTLVNRVEYDLRILKGLVVTNTFYETGSGMELKKEFTYIQVPAGQGNYSWIDYNSNGLQELNEFEVAIFKDQAKYMRVFVPTNQYVKSYSNQFSQSLNIRPGALWAGKKGLRRVLSYIATQTVMKADHKNNNSDAEAMFNPFYRQTSDSNLLAINSSFRNSVFINQSGRVFSITHNYQEARNKQLLTNGFETRSNVYHELVSRLNLSTQWNLQASVQAGVKRNNSEFFSARNFMINYRSVEPRLNYQPDIRFRLSGSFKYTLKQNDVKYGGQLAATRNYGLELRYANPEKGSLDARFNYYNISYRDESNNGALAFELLEGLKAGNNYTWALILQRNLSNNIQLSISYDGRMAGGGKVIHSGGAQARAFF